MRLSKILSIISLLSLTNLLAQNSGDNGYLFPVRPKQINTLAGTMGELRRTHFHTGIDVRTGSRIGVPVQATSNGYINRIAVQTNGYGNALYLKHLDGNISVYAHLDGFVDTLASHVRKEQYKRQKFEVNIFPGKNQFEFQKGDTIGYVGNTGSSAGPHLHFDVRDSNHRLLNPLKFNYTEVVDNLAPFARKIAFKSLDIDARVNGQFGRFEFDFYRAGDSFILKDTVSLHGNIGIELYGYDRQNYTFFRTGIPKIELFEGNKNIFTQEINSFSFSDQRYIKVLTNYKVKLLSGRSFSKLYIDDGNLLSFYSENNTVTRFDENGLKSFNLSLTDLYNNQRIINFTITSEKIPSKSVLSVKLPKFPDWEVVDNTLIITEKFDSTKEKLIELYFEKSKEKSYPAYVINDSIGVFLYDLRKGIPKTFTVCNSEKNIQLSAMIPSGVPFKFYSEKIDVDFSKNSLFDTLYFNQDYLYNSETEKEIFEIHHPFDPLKTKVKITLKPSEIPENKESYAVHAVDRSGKLYYVGGEWEGEHINFETSNFGNFTIDSDTIRPDIKPLIINQNELVFQIEDTGSGIKSFKATLNGKWILMKYDYKIKRIWSEKQDHDIPFIGKLKLIVTDNLNNSSTYKTNL